MTTGTGFDEGVKFSFAIDSETGRYCEEVETTIATIETGTQTIKQGCATKNAAILKNAVIFSVVSIILAGLVIYVMYAGNNGPGALWNLSSHALHLNASIIGGIGLGLASIAMINALCRKALNIHQLNNCLEIVEEKPSKGNPPDVDPLDGRIENSVDTDELNDPFG